MEFDSTLERDASKLLAPQGIVRARGVLPMTFYDSNGAPFKAKADFIHEPTGVLFELKHSSVNDVGTQARAAVKRRKAEGNERHRWIQCDWNHSAAKLALVQEGVARAGGALVALFWHEPDPATVCRLNKRGTFWTVYRSPAWESFVAFLKLRAHGLPVSLTYSAQGSCSHLFA